MEQWWLACKGWCLYKKLWGLGWYPNRVEVNRVGTCFTHDCNWRQVIARENKQGEFGIDYKFSDMINNYASGGSSPVASSTTKSTQSVTRTTAKSTSNIVATLSSSQNARQECYNFEQLG
jgi:hypothetical protein